MLYYLNVLVFGCKYFTIAVVLFFNYLFKGVISIKNKNNQTKQTNLTIGLTSIFLAAREMEEHTHKEGRKLNTHKSLQAIVYK